MCSKRNVLTCGIFSASTEIFSKVWFNKHWTPRHPFSSWFAHQVFLLLTAYYTKQNSEPPLKCVKGMLIFWYTCTFLSLETTPNNKTALSPLSTKGETIFSMLLTPNLEMTNKYISRWYQNQGVNNLVDYQICRGTSQTDTTADFLTDICIAYIHHWELTIKRLTSVLPKLNRSNIHGN